MGANFHTAYTTATLWKPEYVNPPLEELDAILSWLLIPVVLVSGSPLPVDWSIARFQEIDMGGDITFTFSPPTGLKAVMTRELLILAIKTNGHTPSWPTISFGTELTSITLDASKWNFLGFAFNSTTGKYYLVSNVTGY